VTYVAVVVILLTGEYINQLVKISVSNISCNDLSVGVQLRWGRKNRQQIGMDGSKG